MRGSLPRLMEVWDKYEKDRDKFAILTFHETSRAPKLSEIEPQIARLEKDLWKRSLPFPVLVDASGETFRKWGVSQFPTLVLVDPEGAVHYVQVGAAPKFEKLLESKIKEMRDRAAKSEDKPAQTPDAPADPPPAPKP